MESVPKRRRTSKSCREAWSMTGANFPDINDDQRLEMAKRWDDK
jgi:hypothetical protein